MFVTINADVVLKKKFREIIRVKSNKELFRVIKFTLISISAGLIQIGTYALIRLLALYPEGSWQDYVIAYTPSLILSVLWNFTVNRKYTFKSANNIKIAMLLVFAFYAVFTPASTILGGMGVDAGGNSDLVFVVTLLSNFILEFLWTRFVVYKNSCDTAEKKRNESAEKDLTENAEKEEDAV